jgi:hypothetical protein
MQYLKTLSLIALSSATFHASGQRTLPFEFSTPKLGHSEHHSRTLKVIDLRPDSSNVGKVETGQFARKAYLKTTKSFADAIRSLYETIPGNNPADDELLVILHGWRIEDNVYAGEVGTFYFNADFYRGISDCYRKVGEVDSLFEILSVKADVSKVLMRYASKLTDTLLVHYAANSPIEKSCQTLPQAIEDKRNARSTFPIYNTKEFKKGIYYTIDQFLTHEPVDTPFIRDLVVPAGGKKQTPVYYLNEKKKRGKYLKPEMYFAVYDGKSWSISVDGYNLPMQYENGEFITEKELPGLTNYGARGSEGAGALGGGVVAAVIASAAAEKLTWHCYYEAKFDPTTRTFKKLKRLK